MKDYIKRIKKFVFDERKTKVQTIIIVLIYIMAMVLFNIKVAQRQKQHIIFADETSHIAYIAYLEKTNKIIPEFKSMQELEYRVEEEENKFEENTVNHLGHPPLYYLIMRCFNLVKVDGDSVKYDLQKLRIVSVAFVEIGLIIAFYIGFKRFKSIVLNFIYALLIVCMPVLYGTCAGVQNDNLSFLGICIFLLGTTRYFDKNRGYLTYFIIALGIVCCMLAKLTVGIVVLIAIIIILMHSIIKEKNLKIICCKQFLVTVPLYLIILAYYLIIINNYGTIHPGLSKIAPEYFKTTNFYCANVYKEAYTFKVYSKEFWQMFLRTWGGIVNTETYPRISRVNEAIPELLMFVFPIIYFIIKIRKKEKIEMQYLSIYIGLLVAIIMQFGKAYYEFWNVSGYLGCSNSRYYSCLVFPLVFIVVELIDEIYKKIDKRQKDKILLFAMFSLLIIEYIFLFFKLQ